MYECLVGYTPFYADDAPATCRKILEWRRHLVLPVEARAKLSRNCVAFMASLLADRKDRCGSLQDVQSHPWFHDVDLSTLRGLPAPRLPEGSEQAPALLERLRNGNEDPVPLVEALTRNFDDPVHGPAAAFKEEGPLLFSAGTPPNQRRVPDAFVDYTYRRRRPPPSVSTVPLSADEASASSYHKHRADILASFESLTKRPTLSPRRSERRDDGRGGGRTPPAPGPSSPVFVTRERGT
mmetsp:Transcript_18940/g.58379  ORF Transcript_18940/g.58379 Transcript_18940/m.58379 type:complete len:238 (+) Transcript_18940:221-934(+)